MTLGEKIKKFRTQKGLTQKELADEVHVTFQTVSKWEKNENEPDVSTLRELSRIFSCSIDDLLSQSEKTEETEAEESSDNTITLFAHDREAHVCEFCKKDIEDEDDLEISEVCVRRRSRGRSEYRAAYYHKACLEEKKRLDAEQKKQEKISNGIVSSKKCWGWSIASGVITLVVSLIVMLNNPDTFTTGSAIGYSILFTYGIFSMIYCILSGSYIGDVFVWCAGLSIKFPGIIFSWDIDGLAFLIAMKVLFAILGFLIGVAALIFAIALSAILGMVSFPFVLVHNVRNCYDEAI